MQRRYKRNPALSGGELVMLVGIGAAALYLMQQNSLAQQTNAATLAESLTPGAQVSSVLTAGSGLLNSISTM